MNPAQKGPLRILGIVLITLLAAGVVWKMPINLGLDIKRGIDVVMEAQDTPTHKVTADDADKVKVAIERRINQLGVAEPLVMRQGVKRVRIQLPGIKDQKKALAVIGKTAQLSFKDPDGNIILTGDDLKNATGGFDQYGKATVDLVFSKEGKAKFSKATARLANLPTREQRIISMWLDKDLVSAPAVQLGQPINSDRAQITGVGTIEEAKEISVMLRAGALPVPVKVVSHSFVDPILGKDAIDRSMKAGVIGVVLVLLFMFWYYRLPGLIADLALGIWIILTLALLSAVHATLTLPGIAGFILSVGMAVDANVIIFERLKEELHAGKSLRSAVEAGYKRAWTAILDSNICTLLTAAVLFFYGTGTIKGFALTLSLGVISHLFTAIVITRTIILQLIESRPEAMTRYFNIIHFHPKNWNIVGQRKLWMAISVVVLLAGFTALGVKGLNKGIDFQSGTVITVMFEKTVPSAQDITDLLGRTEIPGVNLAKNVVQPAGGDKYIIRAPEMSMAQVAKLVDAMSEKFGKMRNLGTDTIGPVVGKELTRNAFIAVVLASIGILIYIAFRFEVSSAAAAVIALMHDVAIIVGLFAILGREVNSAFVAALLTIIGYSVMDTIIVFDRIRENMRLRKTETFEELVNTSIIQTLARTLNTSAVTLLSIIPLLIMGSPAISDFILALFLGVICGTYSSIFIASPIWLMWRTRSESRGGSRTM